MTEEGQRKRKLPVGAAGEGSKRRRSAEKPQETLILPELGDHLSIPIQAQQFKVTNLRALGMNIDKGASADAEQLANGILYLGAQLMLDILASKPGAEINHLSPKDIKERLGGSPVIWKNFVE